VALCEKGEGATLQVVAIMKKGHEVDLNSNLAIKEDVFCQMCRPGPFFIRTQKTTV